MLLNRVKALTATTTNGTVTLGAAVAPYLPWSSSAVDGGSYSYLIEDGTAWELGRGVYSAGAGTLTRPGPGLDPTFESSTGALLVLSGGASVACVANKADFAPSGSRVLLQDVEVTGAEPSVVLTGMDATKYLNYEIEICDALADGAFGLQMSTDGGATYDTGGNYDWSMTVWGSGGYNNTIQGANSTSIELPEGSNASPNGAGLRVVLFNPGSTTNNKQVTFAGSVSSADGANYSQIGAGRYRNATAVTAVRIVPATGNVQGGRFRLYGIVA